MQGPGPYLNDLGITLPGAVHPDRKAVIDEAHRVFVNYETYYVSDEASRKEFLAAPASYTGPVTDPVTRERFSPAPDSPRRERAGRVFLFSSEKSVAAFDANPDQFSTPMISMSPPAAH